MSRLAYQARTCVAVLIILIAISPPASSDEGTEPRFVPMVGATFKYKNTVQRVTDGETTIGGTITASRVEASDGLIAKLNYHYLTALGDKDICKGDTKCIQENAKYKDKAKLFEIPVPANLSTTPVPNYIEKRYFINTHTVTTGLGATPNKEGKIELRYGFTSETHLTCDWAALTSFFPIGKIARVSIPCSSTSEFIAPPPSPGERRTPGKWEKPLTLSYEGRRSFTNASGTWDVYTVRMVVDGQFENELFFAEKIGAIIRSHLTSQLRTPNFINAQGVKGTRIIDFINDSEMIEYAE